MAALARPAIAFEQAELYFESVGSIESIPDNNVSALAQDQAGFIWIGTPDGLIRYDGYRFRHYDNDPEDRDSLGGDFVRSLLTARDGRLWVGTNADGAYVLDPDSGQIERFRARAGDAAGLSNNSVRALAEDADGGIWIGTREALDHWDPKTGQLRQHRQRQDADGSLGDEQIFALLVDASGDLWIGSSNGLSVRAAATGEFQRLQMTTDEGVSLTGEQVQSLLQLDSGQIIVGTARRGSYVVAGDRRTLRRIPVETDAPTDAIQPSVLSMLQPRQGLLWIAAFGGVDVVDAGDFRLLRTIRPDPAVPSSLAHDQIRALLRDRSGQVWIGGYGGGLQRHDPINEAIRVLRHSPSRPDSLSFPSVSSVLELSDGRIWIGTRGNGVDVWERRRGMIHGYRPDAGDSSALASGVVSALAQSRDGNIWVGTIDGLHLFDAAAGAFQRFGTDDGLPHLYIRRLLVGRDNELWIGTDAGLARRSAGSAQIEVLDGADGAILRADVNALTQAADGRLWVGSSMGLLTVDPETSVLQSVILRSGDKSEPIQAGVVGLLLDRAGQLWADTPNGLHRVHRVDDRTVNFESISARLGGVGVPFGANLHEDREGRIWSQRFVYDPRDDSLYELGRADGADLGTAWFRASCTTHDDLMLFGGSKGLMVVDPSRFSRWQYAPPLAITEIKVDGELLTLDARQGFSLSPRQRGFSVEFAALDFTAPLRNRYLYQLQGFDDRWIETDASRRVVSYNSLVPGSYLLRIRGSGRTGVMSTQELAVAVTVAAAFWQTWWFKLLVLALAALGLAGAARLQSLRIRRRAQQLEQLVARRTAELTQAKEGAEAALAQLQSAQEELVAREKMASLGQLVAGVAHEINTPVGVALTASSYLSERSDALRKALDSGGLQRSELSTFIAQAHEASTMIDQNLRRASDLVKSFKQVSVDRSSDDRRRFDLRDNLRAVVSSLELTWKRRPVQLQLDCPAQIELDSYPGALGQVITNLIQNALLHAFDGGRSGTMRLHAEPVAGDRVRISFEDDGHGIGASELARVFEPFFTTRRAQGGSGLGLHIVYNLVTAKLGGRIEASGERGAGMRFVVTIPVSAP